jgi:predicted metalloprotease
MRVSGLAGRLTVAVAAVALTGACSISTGEDTAGPGAAPIEEVSTEAMTTDEQSAVRATDTYWKNHFSDLFGRDYRSPVVEGGYAGDQGPRCAGQPSVPFNAFYCPSGDFIAWDENLMAAGYRQIGDAWVYLIIAHEWGHAIQSRLDRAAVSMAAELQADCLAGATLQGATRDGLLKIEPGDDQELLQTLVAVADDFPWTSESDHGDAQQRITSFNAGVTDGPAACIP